MMNSKDSNIIETSKKKKYNEPHITEIGKVQNVTQAKPGANFDSGSLAGQQPGS